MHRMAMYHYRSKNKTIPDKQLLRNVYTPLLPLAQNSQTCHCTGNESIQAIVLVAIHTHAVVDEFPQERKCTKHATESNSILAFERCCKELRQWCSDKTDYQRFPLLPGCYFVMLTALEQHAGDTSKS